MSHFLLHSYFQKNIPPFCIFSICRLWRKPLILYSGVLQKLLFICYKSNGQGIAPVRKPVSGSPHFMKSCQNVTWDQDVFVEPYYETIDDLQKKGRRFAARRKFSQIMGNACQITVNFCSGHFLRSAKKLPTQLASQQFWLSPSVHTGVRAVFQVCPVDCGHFRNCIRSSDTQAKSSYILLKQLISIRGNTGGVFLSVCKWVSRVCPDKRHGKVVLLPSFSQFWKTLAKGIYVFSTFTSFVLGQF